MYVPNIADRNLPYNLRISLKLCHHAKLEITVLLTAVADSEGDFLKHNLPLSSYTKQQKKTVQAPGNYPLIYTERISINICILKIKY